MTRRRLVAAIALAALPAAAGELTGRYERAVERVLHGEAPHYSEHFLLADLIPGSKRRFSDFSGDISGRYLGAMSLAGPSGLEAARALAPRVLALQREDGGFGAPLSAEGATEDDMARLWGHGRLLVGLVEYYEASGDEESLAAARRLGDFLLDHATRFNAPAVRKAFQDDARAHGYICWTQNIEALALLARASGDARYREAAVSIASGVERRPGQHAHGWLSSLRGLVLLAEQGEAVTPAIEAAWESFAESEDLLWTGGPPEYFAPGISRDEGCASADWLRLNLALWRLTENERYLRAAENALFNAFYANQLPNGGFGHVRFTEEGFGHGLVEAWWCCTLHGARAFPEIRGAAFRAHEGALYYDLPVDGRGEAAGLVVEADAELALQGRVTMRVLEAPAQPVTLRLRTPARTSALRSPFGASRGAPLEIERIWRAGESFDIEYEMETAMEKDGSATIFRRGPAILGISEGGDPAAFNEAFELTLPEHAVLEPGDRPSREALQFRQQSFGGQDALITLRPISERWESPGHGMRWKVRFEPPPQGASMAARAARIAVKLRPVAAGFAAGILFAAVIGWLWLRRGASR